MTRKTDIKWFPLDRIDDLQRAISAMIADPATTRNGLAFALGLHGLRAREVTNTLAKQFEPLNRRLHVCPFVPPNGTKAKDWNKVRVTDYVCRPLKNGVARTIVLDQTLVDAIVSYRSTIKDKRSRWLLPNRSGESIKPQLVSAKAKAMLIRLGAMDDGSTCFHMLRHTFGMRLYSQTRDLVLVQKQLGHSDPTTTRVYADSLAEVPESCLVKLYTDGLTDPYPGAQLRLFSPHGQAS